MSTRAGAVAAAPVLDAAVLAEPRWEPHIDELRKRWRAVDRAYTETRAVEAYTERWISDEPGDTTLWPRHIERMSGLQLVEHTLDADQRARDATAAGRAYAMHVARLVTRAVYEARWQPHDPLTNDRLRPSKITIAKIVVAHLTNRCRARESRAELFPPLLRPGR